MPGKLYHDNLAAAIKASGDKHYRPSNGDEGLEFQERWCLQCEKDRSVIEREDYGNGCQILADALAYSENESEYPPEWTYDNEGQPCCTAFEPLKDTETLAREQRQQWWKESEKHQRDMFREVPDVKS